ncbi:RxLR effector protein [Phytophthora megakarya]|uniref:RxLR effector protein n=1 Tax=Phytophthora megakarya TaxID=4795 RepID=A0A225VSL9_9STRA|nr:RxLR effector protein [Phytophthora megakarya]
MSLFVSLRKIPGVEDLAHSMILELARSDRYKNLLNEAWLKAGENPSEVFKILQLKYFVSAKNPTFVHWMRYTDMYSEKTRHSFPVTSLLTKTFHERSTTPLFYSEKLEERNIAVLFESLKAFDDVKPFAEKLQLQLFDKWMNELKLKPTVLGDEIELFKKDGPIFSTIESYTLHFAEHEGGKALVEKVGSLFAKNDFRSALVAAEKA